MSQNEQIAERLCLPAINGTVWSWELFKDRIKEALDKKDLESAKQLNTVNQIAAERLSSEISLVEEKKMLCESVTKCHQLLMVTVDALEKYFETERIDALGYFGIQRKLSMEKRESLLEEALLKLKGDGK